MLLILRERELTASASCAPLSWPSARRHNKWPGTGRRGDPVFANYCAGRNTAISSPAVRQTLSVTAIVSVLQWLAPTTTILVREGGGATAAWLAADRAPQLVAGIIAVEPDGPPFVSADSYVLNGTEPRNAKSFQTYSGRRYGIPDIPLFFHPAIPNGTFGPSLVKSSLSDHSPCIFRLTRTRGSTGRGKSYLQDERQAGARANDPFAETIDTYSCPDTSQLGGLSTCCCDS